ncbi:MAG: helix-turn-helix domain-containing protein [Chloroflexota bacterium]|nr:helix-turn-helix domain-containing protein [Chloroflexota bacterium]
MLERKLVVDESAGGAYCPVRATLALIGQKWVPHIFHELSKGKRRFNELAQAVGGVNPRTLKARLTALEKAGVVRRRVVETMPPWVEYELTPAGQELAQVLAALGAWGMKHLTPEVLSTLVRTASPPTSC